MGNILNEQARILTNDNVGPRLYLMTLKAPSIAAAVQPGQFVHMEIPGKGEHVLRRPFSVYDVNLEKGIVAIIYQEVGSLTSFMPSLKEEALSIIGPIGASWSALQRADEGKLSHALLVGGGVGAAPLHLLAKGLKSQNIPFDVIMGAQTKDALVCHESYCSFTPVAPFCATDDGTFGTPGFCTSLVTERLTKGCSLNGAPYDYIAVCGPEPLMKIVNAAAQEAGVYCEVSLEKRMACGVGACLSCVVDTIHGKKRSCVDGPIFNGAEVIW